MFSEIFGGLIAKTIFVPLLFTIPYEEFKHCKSDDDCNIGFSCEKHVFYQDKICKTNRSVLLTQYTPFMIEQYGSMVGCDKNMIRMLQIIAQRESHGKWWEHHWHQSDIKSIRTSRARLENKYSDSEFWAQKKRWLTYGLFGMNSVNFIHRLNPQLPPQILKHPYFAILAYKRAADLAFQKLRHGVKCTNKNGEQYTFHGSLKNKVTLSDIHAAVSGGSICPRKSTSKKEQWMKQHASFTYKVYYKG